MNILKLKPMAMGAAICALSFGLSTAAFAAGGMRGGPSASAPSHPSMQTHVSAPTTRATTTPQAKGQPNQSCGSASAPNTPGNAAAAPGSAFNPNGTAGTVYAGQQPQNSKNPVSVSQYDVACSHQP